MPGAGNQLGEEGQAEGRCTLFGIKMKFRAQFRWTATASFGARIRASFYSETCNHSPGPDAGGGEFKSHLLRPSRSAPIGANCIPFEMGEVCLALQRDLQPPTHPPLVFFCCICDSQAKFVSVWTDCFLGFRLLMGCRVCSVYLQSFGS